MKTSELIKRINELDCGFGISKDENDGITLKIWNGNEIMIVTKSNVDLFQTWYELGSPLDKGIKLMFEYAYTPLEEREEEKKYRLRLPNGFESMLGEDYVCLTSDKVRERYVITAKETYHGFRNIFTQKEIDAMPFDTNFFINEEVL